MLSPPTSPVAGTGPDVTESEDGMGYALEQNRPNPFNGKTTISFSVAEANHTTLTVYSSIGQEVAVLFNEMPQPDKVYSVQFDGKNQPKGIYFYRLQSGKSVNVMKKMIMIK
jgi:hypothetical protein